MRVVATLCLCVACARPAPPAIDGFPTQTYADASFVPSTNSNPDVPYKEVFRREFRKHFNELKDCWDNEVERRPGIGWQRPIFVFTIVHDGRVYGTFESTESRT